MNIEETVLPGFCVGALAMASGTDFTDTALGIAGPLAATNNPSKRKTSENPIATVDNNPEPRANEV